MKPAERDPSLLSTAQVCAAHGLDPSTGLSADEARRRLSEHGPNELRQKPPVPLWRKVLAQFQDPLVYLLFAAMGISLAAWLAEGTSGVPIDVVVIALIVVANAALGLAQERKAEGAVAALAKLTAATSTVVRDGALVTVSASELVPGDLLVLGEGDAVGADARLLSATSLKVQESSLTGESEATAKQTDPLASLVALGDRSNMVFRGTAVVHGVGRAVVTATGMGTQMGAIADMLDASESEPSPLEREIAGVSKALGLLVLGIAAVVMATLWLVSDVRSFEDAVEILLLGVSLAVAAVPEGLPAILSLVLAIGVQAMAKRNAVMKDLHSVETLGSASVIASDKTGTLTRNEMMLSRVLTASGEVRLTGSGYDPAGGPADPVVPEALAEAALAVGGGAIANNAQLSFDGGWRVEGDPTEAAFLVAARKLEGATELAQGFERAAEVPFSSERKLMSVGGRDGQGLRLYTKGAPDVLLAHCVTRQVGAEVRALSDGDRQEILAGVERLSGSGYRTLGVASRELPQLAEELAEDAEEGLTFLGVVAIVDPPRAEAAEAIREAQRAEIRTMMITGDHPRTAARIGADLGIVGADGRALTGVELDALSEDEFRLAVREVSIYARVSPAHKLSIIDALQDDGLIVAMTGDGVNDAPALKSADIGIAMGITGTEVTKEAGKMILADDNYATIVSAVRQGRGIFDNIKKFLRFLLSSNMGEVTTVFFGVLLAGVLGLADATGATLAVPLLATQILWINLVTDSGPALAMGVDPDDGDLMARPPRDPRKAIIDRRMWYRIGFIGAVMGAVSLVGIDLFLPGGLFTLNDSSLEVARTAGFTTLVFAQLFNALNSRSDERSAFRGMFANRWLWASILLAVVLQVTVVHLPVLQTAFGTAPLSPGQWAVTAALASAVLWAEELAKLVRAALRRQARR